MATTSGRVIVLPPVAPVGRTSPAPARTPERWAAAGWYAALALLSIPVFSSGYLLLVDWVPTPVLRWDVTGVLGVHHAPSLAVLGGLGAVIPVWLLQRLVLWAAIWGAGMAAHAAAPVRSPVARFFAGTVYALSPLILVRVQAGQWRVLAAYALMPLAVRAILALLRRQDRRTGLVAGAWIAGVALVSAHALVLLVAVLAVATIVAVGRGRTAVPGLLWAGVTAAAGVAWWVVPALVHPAPAASGVETLDAFATGAVGGTSLPVTVAGLRGFWIDAFTPTDPVIWPLVGIALAALAMAGAAIAVRDQRRPAALVLLLAAGAAFVFALGVASPAIEPAVRPLYRNVRGLLLLREPLKALALVALAYAWLGAIAVDRLRASAPRAARGASLGLLVLPFLLSPQALGVLGDRLRPVAYPSSWARAERIMAADPDRFAALSLPWQLYSPLPWSDPARPVANPAPTYFSVPVLASDDPQLVAGPEGSRGPVALRMEGLLQRRDSVRRLGAAVAPLGVKYVLLVPETRPGAYAFLRRQEDLRVLLASEDLILFRNLAWRPGRSARP